jgi:hypothetical protein
VKRRARPAVAVLARRGALRWFEGPRTARCAPVRGRQFNVMLDYTVESAQLVSAIENIDGQGFASNERTHEGAVLPAQGRFEVVCMVRRTRVTIDVDGRRITSWSGDPARLSRNDYWETPHGAVASVGAYMCSYRVHRLELTTISGTGHPLRPVPTRKTSGDGKTSADGGNSSPPPR